MKKNMLYFFSIVCITLCACHSAPTTTEADAAPDPVVPVTVVNISSGPMEETTELNATSTYLQRWILKSNATGYLQGQPMQVNKPVSNGQVLFTIKTKEAAAIGNTINKLDPSFHFSGLNQIRSMGAGFISELNHQPGDYVQDGEQLAVITDTKSFAFVMDLPYEMRPFISAAKTLQLLLPDGEQLTGTLTGNLPSMDSASQTQRVILKVNAGHPIPENLIAKVKLIKKESPSTYFLPRAAVLSDETQTSFWVMKMLNDSTAVKTNIKKGMETAGKIEITEPVFSANDRILLTGNFGLNDTAHVKIMQAASE